MQRMFFLLMILAWSNYCVAQEPPSKISNNNKENKVALVIGNASYQGVAALKNPVNDAHDVSEMLAKLGFDVTLKANVTLKEMTRAITRFGEKLKQGDVALFYYAGHGLQAKGRNFMVPVDAEIISEAGIRSETVDVDQLLEQLAPARLSIVILDACRNNPYERSFRSLGGAGLAQIDAPKGTLIAYATAPGRVAADGGGRNGLYTSELLKALSVPEMTVEGVFKTVRVNVAKASADRQIPWESSSLTGEFCFSGCGNAFQKQLHEIERQQKINDEELSRLRIENDRIEKEKKEVEKRQAKIEEELAKQKSIKAPHAETERLTREKEALEKEKLQLQADLEREKERLRIEYDRKVKEERERSEKEALENRFYNEGSQKNKVFIPPSF